MDLRVIAPQKGQVYLLFYKPTAQDPLQNRLVSYFDGPFCHVEMAIPNRYGDDPSQKVMWGSSIYQNEAVFFKQKSYRRDGYVSIAIEVSMQQLQTVKQFCTHHAEQQTPFSIVAMYAAYLPFQLIETDATFCSKHVAHALQMAGVSAVEGINPALTTPSMLYRQLTRTAIVQVVPTRMVTPQQLHPPAVLSLFFNNNNNNNNNNINAAVVAAAPKQNQSQCQTPYYYCYNNTNNNNNNNNNNNINNNNNDNNNADGRITLDAYALFRQQLLR
jgi:hypothetical protein